MLKEHKYANILKIINDPKDDYTIGCQLDYPHFNEHFKMISIGLNKEQAFNADQKAIQKVNLIGNKKSAGNTNNFFSFLKK